MPLIQWVMQNNLTLDVYPLGAISFSGVGATQTGATILPAGSLLLLGTADLTMSATPKSSGNLLLSGLGAEQVTGRVLALGSLHLNNSRILTRNRQDDFGRTQDPTLPLGSPSDGLGDWTSNGLSIYNNFAAYCSAVTGDWHTDTLDIGVADATAQATIIQLTQYFGLALRYEDDDNQYRLLFVSPDSYTIEKIVAGVETVLAATTNFTIAGDTVGFQIVGSMLTAYHNGNIVTRVTDSDLTAGTRHGLVLHANSLDVADAFSIVSPGTDDTKVTANYLPFGQERFIGLASVSGSLGHLALGQLRFSGLAGLSGTVLAGSAGKVVLSGVADVFAVVASQAGGLMRLSGLASAVTGFFHEARGQLTFTGLAPFTLGATISPVGTLGITGGAETSLTINYLAGGNLLMVGSPFIWHIGFKSIGSWTSENYGNEY